MTEEQMQLLALKGLVAEMPPEHQKKINDVKARISAIQTEAGEVGVVALMLCAAEIAMK